MRELERSVLLACSTASGASTSTRWTTSRRASACGRWPSATRWSSTSARASTCSPRMLEGSRRSRSASCSTSRSRPRRDRAGGRPGRHAAGAGRVRAGRRGQGRQDGARRSAAKARRAGCLRAKGIDDEESPPLTYSGPAEDGSAEVKRNGGGAPAAGGGSGTRKERREAARQQAKDAEDAAPRLTSRGQPMCRATTCQRIPVSRRHLLDPAGDRVHPLVRGCRWRPPRPPLPSVPTGCTRTRRRPGGAAPVVGGPRPAASESTSPAASSGRSWASGPAPVDHLEHPAQCGVGEAAGGPQCGSLSGAAAPAAAARPAARAAGQAHRAGSACEAVGRLVVDDRERGCTRGVDGQGSPVIGRQGDRLAGEVRTDADMMAQPARARMHP